jgi:signal transduction histidine kinase
VVATLDANGVEDLRELDQLREAVVDLRSSRGRLVLADDADRRRIERDLHQGVQQHLVALSANLQLAGGLAPVDRPDAKALLDEMLRIVDVALDDTRKLAQRIYPPLLDAGGLAVALRSAAASARIRARIEIDAHATYPPAVARTVYLCCLDAFEQAPAGSEAVVTTRVEEGAFVFDVVAECAFGDVDVVHLRDRVEALGGQLTIGPGADRGTRAVGSIPLSE